MKQVMGLAQSGNGHVCSGSSLTRRAHLWLAQVDGQVNP